jgi:hypothetical protein
LLGAKVSHVTEKNYLMQFILHINGKNLKELTDNLKHEQYSMIRVAPTGYYYSSILTS